MKTKRKRARLKKKAGKVVVKPQREVPVHQVEYVDPKTIMEFLGENPDMSQPVTTELLDGLGFTEYWGECSGEAGTRRLIMEALERMYTVWDCDAVDDTNYGYGPTVDPRPQQFYDEKLKYDLVTLQDLADDFKRKTGIDFLSMESV